MELKINSKKYGEKNFIIDDDDFDIVKNFKWYLVYDPHKKDFYVRTVLNKKRILLHRMLMNCPDNLLVDHKNGFCLDNRRENLRICTHAENNRNCKKPVHGKTSKYKGVCFVTEKKKFKAQIKLNRKQNFIGYFKTDIEAAIAYNKKAIEFFGEFAKLNEVSI